MDGWTNAPSLGVARVVVRDLQNGKHARRDAERCKFVVHRPNFLRRRNLLDQRRFLHGLNVPIIYKFLARQAKTYCTATVSTRRTHSFSYSEWLLEPNLLQKSSNVICVGACSLTLQCQCAPSPEPLGLKYVWTVFFSYALPFFQPLVASSTSRDAAMTCSSEGNST